MSGQDLRQDVAARIATGSKSFSMAGKLMPRDRRLDAHIVYAWCRRADDQVDQAAPDEQPDALDHLRSELQVLYAGGELEDSAIDAFGQVVQHRAIPVAYPEEMLHGMEMDVAQTRYNHLDTLLHYCFRVAGTVGLMMSHVMGLTEDAALDAAAKLGMAMQLTNICRDVLEDWGLGRLYVPASMLPPAMADLASEAGGPLPATAVAPLADALQEMHAIAGRLYRSAEQGFLALPWRCSLAMRAARRIYAAIGDVVRARGYDVRRGRAVVGLPGKLGAVGRAVLEALGETPRRVGRGRAEYRTPERVVTFAGLRPAVEAAAV